MSIGPKTPPPSFCIRVCSDRTSNLNGYWTPRENKPQLSSVRTKEAGQPDTLTRPGLKETTERSRDSPVMWVEGNPATKGHRNNGALTRVFSFQKRTDMTWFLPMTSNSRAYMSFRAMWWAKSSMAQVKI